MFEIHNNIAKILIFSGAVMILLSVVFYLSHRWPWVGRLPGDIYIEKEGFSFFFPLTTCLIISLIISLVFILLGKR